MKQKNHLQNNRGATSVLIMIMMIILMVFGVAALTTSVASRKLAQKNAGWLKDYYALQGEAEVLHARLVEALNLEEAGDDLDEVESALHQFLKEHANCSFEKTDREDQPFIIDMNVQEEGKEIPKNIQMKFLLLKEEGQYRLRIVKRTQYQAEIFDPEDELHFSDVQFSDIKPE